MASLRIAVQRTAGSVYQAGRRAGDSLTSGEGRWMFLAALILVLINADVVFEFLSYCFNLRYVAFFSDDWGALWDFFRVRDGGFDWTFFNSANNDHRVGVIRTLFQIDLWGQFDGLVLFWASITAAALNSILLYLIFARYARTGTERLLVASIVVFAGFNPMHGESLIWLFSIGSHAVFASLLLALNCTVLAYRYPRRLWPLIGVAVGLFGAIELISTGVLGALVLTVLVAAARRQRSVDWRIIGLCLAAVLLFFAPFPPLSHYGDPVEASLLTKGRAALDLSTGLIGWPVFPAGRMIQILVGAVGLLIAGIVGGVFALRAWKRQEIDGWFEAAVLLGTVTAAGIAFGFKRPDWTGGILTFATRYAAPALIFWPVVALLPLVVMRHTERRNRVAMMLLPFAALMAILPMLWLARAKATMERFVSELKEGGMALTVGVADPDALHRLAPFHQKEGFVASLHQVRGQMDRFDLPPFENSEADVIGLPARAVIPPGTMNATKPCSPAGAPTDVAGFPLFAEVGPGRGVRLRQAYESFDVPPSSIKTALALDPSSSVVGLGATFDVATPRPLTVLGGLITRVPVEPTSDSRRQRGRVLVFARGPVAAVLLLDRELQPRCLVTLPETVGVPPSEIVSPPPDQGAVISRSNRP